MPNEHGQVTVGDFKAPPGQYRITREDMEDGALYIIADIFNYECAIIITNWLREEDENSVFLLWDDKGQEIIC
ncbi:MAG: hypothetical protein NTZ49_01895 [Candidatus Parcubacteria bacterium]|nr:hypothetical protein [Candidatus Parcubacteria bacterium]